MKPPGLFQIQGACGVAIGALSWLCLVLPGLLDGQSSSPGTGMDRAAGSASASPYKLEWRQHFQLQSGLVPAGTADEGGTLWLITRPGPGKPEEFLTRIDSEGRLTGNLDPQLPLKPIEWVGYLSPASSGRTVGLLASLVSGGRYQTFEGAFFVPVGPDGPGTPRRIADRGPQFPTLVGVGGDQFIAAGDQEPLTLLKLDSAGTLLWRRSFSRNLVLPTVAVGADARILVVSQGGSYLQLHLVDESGRLLASRRISARQGICAADAHGGWSILLSKGFGGAENRVYLLTLDSMLRQLNAEIETPLRGVGGRTYQLISTPRGHLIIGDGLQNKTIAELETSGRLIWQQKLSGDYLPRLVPFRTGFYIVKDVSEGEGMDVEKYRY